MIRNLTRRMGQKQTQLTAEKHPKATRTSPAVMTLSRFLESDVVDATIADDGQSVHVTKAADSYRTSLDTESRGLGPPSDPTRGSG